MSEAGHRPRVLIVDDSPETARRLTEALKEQCDVQTAASGRHALEQAGAGAPPDLILLAVGMREMGGHEVCERLKGQDATRRIPVILTTLAGEADVARGFSSGAADYIRGPFNADLVKNRVRAHLELRRYEDHLDELVRERTRELELMQEVTVESLGTLAEFRDPETGGHIKRTQAYVRELATKLSEHPTYQDQLDERMIHLLYLCAPLHDIGKVGVPDSILLKEGKLTEEEFEIMKQHTVLGRDALRVSEDKLDSDFFRVAREIAYSHQEKWDGSGYPQGLKGEEIPLSGRLMAVADVYDALISKRVYKAPVAHEEAAAIIRDGADSHFDPDIVKAFDQLGDTFRQIALRFADFEEERERWALVS